MKKLNFYLLSVILLTLTFSHAQTSFNVDYGDYNYADSVTYASFGGIEGDISGSPANGTTYETIFEDESISATDSLLAIINFGDIIPKGEDTDVDTLFYIIQGRIQDVTTTIYSKKYGDLQSFTGNPSFRFTFRTVENSTDTLVIKSNANATTNSFTIWKGGGNLDPTVITNVSENLFSSKKILISNPVRSSTLNVSLSEDIPSCQLELLSMKGEVLSTHLFTQSDQSIDISNIKSGLYILRHPLSGSSIKLVVE